MKRLQLTTLLLLVAFILFGQQSNVINVNPDKNGDPWIIDGYDVMKNKKFLPLEEVLNIKSQYFNSNKKQQRVSANFPEKVDNSALPYMRPTFSQEGGSCGSSSRICYMFAYEINCFRRISGALEWNKYPSHFTWLLTGQDSDKEDMARDNGIPNSLTYGGNRSSKIYGGGNIYWPNLEHAPDYGWMQGYDKWYKAMNNRIEKSISFRLGSIEALNLLKSWFVNHWGDNDFPAGGVAGAGCATKGADFQYNKKKQYFVKKWGPTPDHGTTWVGYDDTFEYDFNGDGKITNDKDLNGDGKVNFKDWERGALIMRNTWGVNWGNRGNIYVPYRYIDMHGAELYFIRKNYTPRRTMKITMNYNHRSKIKISVGVSDDINAQRPKRTLECEHFKFAGNGDVPMLGKPLKYFLKIQAKPNAGGKGVIKSISVLNYDNYTPIETQSDQKNVEIRNGKITYVSVVMAGGKEIPSKYLSTKDWKVVRFNSEDKANQCYARNAIDGNPNTFWHTQWQWGGGVTPPNYPHYIVVNMGKEELVSELEYLPRQDGQTNGTVAKYELYLSENGKKWGKPVSKGEWNKNSLERVIKFEPTKARYFKFKAISEVNGKRYASAAELRFLKSDVPPMFVPNKDWEVIDYSSENTSSDRLAKYAIDGYANTMWQTKTNNGAMPYHITVDMHKENTLSVFEYIPRQDKYTTGMIKDYQLFLSNDPNNWGKPVATGTWESNHEAKIISFKETNARYFKLVALSEIKGKKMTTVADLRFWNNDFKTSTGIKNITFQSENNLEVYSSNKDIIINRLTQKANVYIVNISGRLMLKRSVYAKNNTIKTQLQSGVYLVNILQDNGGLISKKVIIR